MKGIAVPLTAALVALLPSCGPDRIGIDFATHPSVLRGVWAGTTASRGEEPSLPVRLEAQATYVHRLSYSIAGTFTVGDGPAQPLTGTGFPGEYTQYVQPQRTPLREGFRAVVKDSGGRDEWELYGSFQTYDSHARYHLYLRGPLTDPDNRREYTVTIRRAP